MYKNRKFYLTVKHPSVRLTQNRFVNHTVLFQTKRLHFMDKDSHLLCKLWYRFF